ncbi:MAG: M20/M25/M40 family metallo-hydrolase [Planctomycetota bacterium]|nr:M20/M25/M40 family metallo-hydrolase [Planctomycetota bacterium]MDA1262533.1 M20/M25/M40 family metallo-hydrolase [Planctomycetota bacterium]
MNYELLKRLCEVAGIPGREERVRALVQKEIKGLFDTTTTDAMGSLICTKKATRKKKGVATKRVLIAAHMDEIGFYVRHIDEQGYLWLNPAGGFDPRNLFSRRVMVITDHGDFQGVLNPGGKPIHISSDAERNKVPGTEEFFIDLGRDPAEVRKIAQVGDFVVMHEPFFETPLKVVSKAIDNRMAVFTAIEAIRRVAKSRAGHSCDIVVAFTTQEEVGLRGAQVAANAAGAEIGIGLDVNLACDTPGIPDNQRVTKQGLGVAVMIQDSSMISDIELVRQSCALAKRHRIAHQRAILPRGGQDAGAIQRSGNGARCIAFGPGTRYIHTVTEMVHKADLEATVELLAVLLGDL